MEMSKKAKLKLGTHTVIKNDDIKKYLTETETNILSEIIMEINFCRHKDDKGVNDYYVVNVDEPYAEKVLDLILTEEAKKEK